MIKILICIYIIYKMLNFEFLGKVINIILPFILAFVLAYILDPILKRLNKYLPKQISIFLIILLILISSFFVLSYLIPLLIDEINIIIDIIIYYINILENKYNIDLSMIINSIYTLNYKHIISGISISIDYITKLFLIIISFIYFLNDMDYIVCLIKKRSNNKFYNCLSLINSNLKKYISSLFKISIISFFEYSLAFILIGHSNPFLIGLVSFFANLIPYIGSILVLIIGIILSPSIIIKISILYLILGFIDSYFINPYIYGKYNSINPLISIISMTLFSYLFGIIGLIFAIPLTIIVMTIIKYYKADIYKLIKSNKFVK